MADEEPKTFESALQELETIVRSLERGDPTLEDSLASFERGVQLLRWCHGRIDAAETRISKLVEIDPAGNAKLRPFEHEATVAPPAASRRHTQRERPAEPSGSNEDIATLF